MSEIDSVYESDSRQLVDVFRDFETALWAHINEPDSPDGRRAVALQVAAELTRIQHNVATELEIVS